MTDILFTRLLLWKKKVISMLFWFLLPILGTYLFITIANTIQEDSRVPIGIVMEDDSDLGHHVLESITESELVQVHETTKKEALYQLEKHELDSVFIIHEGFEQAVNSGMRNKILSSYRTELSIAYSPIKEMIVSLVQEQTGRAKAANFILEMNEQYNGTEPWTLEEIQQKTIQVQIDENLLNTAFTYYGTTNDNVEPTLISWNTWTIWAIFSLLSSLFLFDWVIKEKSLAVSARYTFIHMSKWSYYFKLIILYFLIFLLFDFMALAVFTVLLDEAISLHFIFVLISFRFMLCMLSFSIASFFRKTARYYGISLLMVIVLAILTGAIIPVHQFIPEVPFADVLNPLHAFISGNPTILWSSFSFILVLISLFRKDVTNA